MFGPSSRKPSTRPRCPGVVVLAQSHEKSRQSRACSSIAAATPSPFLLQWQCRIALDPLRALDFAFSVKLGKLLVGGSVGADGGAKLVKLRADFVKLLAQAGGLGGMAVGHLAQVVLHAGKQCPHARFVIEQAAAAIHGALPGVSLPAPTR